MRDRTNRYGGCLATKAKPSGREAVLKEYPEVLIADGNGGEPFGVWRRSNTLTAVARSNFIESMPIS
jgi:hypothetical protein